MSSSPRRLGGRDNDPPAIAQEVGRLTRGWPVLHGRWWSAYLLKVPRPDPSSLRRVSSGIVRDIHLIKEVAERRIPETAAVISALTLILATQGS